MTVTGCERLAIEARFIRYLIPLPNGCMIWTGGRSKGGPGKEGRRKRGGPYGTFRVNMEIGPIRAHIVWAWLRGIIPEPKVPEGHHLDHHCCSGTLCVCCTDLVTKAVNLSLSKTRPKDTVGAAQAKARADGARQNRRRREARRRKAGNPKKLRGAQNSC